MNRQMLTLRCILPRCISSLLLAAWLPAQASPNNVSDGEIAMLPPYCLDAQWSGRNMDMARRAVWRSRLGRSFEGLHHYCWGLVLVRRASILTDKNKRNFMLGEAVADYIYTIENSTKDFVLLPEIYYRMGEAHAASDNVAGALAAFEASRKLKPDYWPAYLKAAELLERGKTRSMAVDLLYEGLRHSPEQSALMARYKALGGTRPIEPLPQRGAPAEPASSPASAAADS